MSYVISNYGSEPPYGPTLELSDDMFTSPEQAAAFGEGYAALMNDHTASVGQDYRMTRNFEPPASVQLWPPVEQ